MPLPDKACLSACCSWEERLSVMEVETSLIHRTGLLMVDSRSTCILEAGELIVARAYPEDVRAVGELVGKDSEMPFRDSSGDGVTRSGRVRRIES